MLLTVILFVYVYTNESKCNSFVLDFQKIGGYQVFMPGLNSEHAVVRCKTAELIATLLQHNPYCQGKFIECTNYTEKLMHLVQNDPADEVRVKSLHALSSEPIFLVNFF